MKLLFLNFILFFTKIRSSDISQALSDTIHAMFVQNQIHFDIIVYGDQSRNISYIINDIGLKNNESYAKQIQSFKTTEWDHNLKQSAVILMSNFRYVLLFFDLAKLDSDFYKTFKFLIYCEDLQVGDFYDLRFKKLYWRKGLPAEYSYFLFEREESFTLLSLEWYSEKACNKAQFITINEFNKADNKWIKKLEVGKKFRNFYGCLISMDVGNFFKHIYFDHKGRPKGPLVDIFNGMSVRGNLTQHIQRVYTYFDKNFKIRIAKMQNAKYDMIPELVLTLPEINVPKVQEMTHLTTYFYEITYSFMISPPEPYSAFEKLLLPFDETTWIFFIAVFLYAFVSILVINLVSSNLQDMFYGENVKTPIFNVVGTFFGISQTSLPDANFPRILLMTFILYCLILRTAYQSLLFEYVATDMRKSSPTTVDELLEADFTLYSEYLPYDWLVQLIPKANK
ncbi:unnamed protein product [Chironomus riparius]|uniref:Ionotropic receptor n=1 Tax=Chironomus riparius TaxID=315576 RepID=A0A9N9S589_9DIPT|nr:unnamed protein product [Chironomus riparius]